MDDVLVGDDVDDAMRELFSKGYLWVRKDPETGELEIKVVEDVRAAVATIVDQLGIGGEQSIGSGAIVLFSGGTMGAKG